MKRIGFGAAALMVIVGLVATWLGRSGERTYTVDTVVSGLQQQPTAWAGRTILVRGAIIAYDAEWWSPQQQGAGQDGCELGFRTVSACQRSIAFDLAHLQPGSTVRLVIAPQARLFTYQGDPLLIVPQNPPGTLVVRFRVPPKGLAANGLLPWFLRHVPAVASFLPVGTESPIPIQGVFHLRLSAHPAHDRQHDHTDGTLMLTR